MKLVCLLLVMLSASANAASFDHSHPVFSKLLSDVVVIKGHTSRVNYALLIERRGELDAYLNRLSGISRSRFDGFTESQQLAFLINTYNGYQLKQVIDHYPLKSIKDVGSFFSSPWSKEFFTLFGEPASLDFVEHQLIRKLFAEPRIHFAVNCASISCPPLANQAYQADQLEDQLQAAAVNFLNDRSANYIDGNTLYLSKIFDWYEEDFTPAVVPYVAQYWSEVAGSPKGLKVSYTSYDWNLNEI